MSSPQGSEAAINPRRGPVWGPGGAARNLLRVHADALSTDLYEPQGETPIKSDGLPTWSPNDYDAFRLYSDFRNTLDYIEPHDETGEDFWHAVDLFHASLPFSEGERRWLLDARRATWSAEYEKYVMNFPESVTGVETTITSNGLRRIIKGRELVRRWSAWRREIDEFDDRGTVKEAQYHAKEIARLVKLGAS